MKTKKPRMYDVTLRRDVQQMAKVRVEAFSQQEAIDVAENCVDDAWTVEEHIGTHKPTVKVSR